MSIVYTAGTAPAITSYNSLASINTTATAAASSAAYTTDTTKATVDAQFQLTVVTPAFTPTASTGINIYVYGSADGTTWPGAGATSEVIAGTDAAVTLSTLGNNAKWVGFLLCHTSGGTFKSEPISVKQAFGGILPKKWCVLITNGLPAAASLAASGHAIVVTEISY